jgi:uncharacterized membrane protein
VPYCSKCGTQVPEAATFCQKCGQPQPASAAPAQHSGLSQNTAATLSYVLGWLTGLIFFLIDKRPYVRFHAAQSIITFGGFHAIKSILGMAFGVGWWYGGWRHVRHAGPAWALISLVSLVSLVLWIVLMVKAYRGERYKLPIAGDLAENLAGR